MLVPEITYYGCKVIQRRCCRLLGRAVYCQELLEEEGNIVSVPLDVAENSRRPLTGYLRPALEAAAGGTLDAYRLQQPLPSAGNVTVGLVLNSNVFERLSAP